VLRRRFRVFENPNLYIVYPKTYFKIRTHGMLNPLHCLHESVAAGAAEQALHPKPYTCNLSTAQRSAAITCNAGTSLRCCALSCLATGYRLNPVHHAE
jgi:hypothetical protein